MIKLGTGPANAGRDARKNTIGKRETEHERGTQEDTNAPPQLGSYLDILNSATTGSAIVDLATAVEITLQNTDVQVIPPTANGHLGYGLSALLIGRSFTSKQGISVLPRLSYADYLCNIGIMVQTLMPPIHIPKGTQLAKLVPFKAKVPRQGVMLRGEWRFWVDGSHSGNCYYIRCSPCSLVTVTGQVWDFIA
ncbi:hypothetical protein TURU_129884 [Turdus rufiventris]|nr:hypothetical protein TURU_129884 [Turdus rufiventris]